MEALSVREYRNNLAASFTKADNGEQVLIRRKKEIYALVKVGREDLIISPENDNYYALFRFRWPNRIQQQYHVIFQTEQNRELRRGSNRVCFRRHQRNIGCLYFPSLLLYRFL